MLHQPSLQTGADSTAVFAGTFRSQLEWRGLTVGYFCLPPLQGAIWTAPNRIEVVFSQHHSVALEQDGKNYDVTVPPGSSYVVGTAPVTLRNVEEHSDTLEVYPDVELLSQMADAGNIRSFELQPTLGGAGKLTCLVDPIVITAAHVLRQACLGRITLSDVQGEEIAQRIAARVLHNQYGVTAQSGPGTKLTDRRLRNLIDYVEAHLTTSISLSDLAKLAGISPFHFARSFKKTTGLAPHQFVAARRFDLARRLLITTDKTVHDVALSVGYENLSHFRRKFVAQFGIGPAALRRTRCTAFRHQRSA